MVRNQRRTVPARRDRATTRDEFGTYVVAGAAATGISGIIAPWTVPGDPARVDRQAIVTANVSLPVRTTSPASDRRWCRCSSRRSTPAASSLDARVKLSRRTWRRIVIVLAVALGAYLTIGVLLAGRGLPPVPPSVVPVDLHGGHVLSEVPTVPRRVRGPSTTAARTSRRTDRPETSRTSRTASFSEAESRICRSPLNT